MSRKLVVNMSITLDGVMQAPGTPDEDPRAGFTHGGWIVNYWAAVYERAGAIEYGSFGLDEPTEAEIARREKLAREG